MVQARGLKTITVAALSGFALGAAGYLVFAPSAPEIGDLRRRLDDRRARPQVAAKRQLAPQPGVLFPNLTETAEPAIRVIGVSRRTGRQAMLVSVNGQASKWLEVGETTDGFTLVAVRSDGGVIESANGSRTLKLGENAAAAPAQGGPAALQAEVVP